MTVVGVTPVELLIGDVVAALSVLDDDFGIVDETIVAPARLEGVLRAVVVTPTKSVVIDPSGAVYSQYYNRPSHQYRRYRVLQKIRSAS